MSWSKLELTIPDLGLTDFADLINKLRQLLEVLVGILDAILTAILAFTDPIVALIKTLIDQLKALLESILKDLGAYMLFVPVRKRLMTDFLGLGDVTPTWTDSLGLFQAPTSAVEYDNPELNEFITRSNRYNGGNGGFFRTVLESLQDQGDINRPQFLDDADWVGGVIMVIGTSLDPLGFLDDIWALTKIFDGPEPLPTMPKPKNLRARAMTNMSAGTFDVLLTWDTVELPFTYIRDLGNTMYYPERYAIIRSKNNCGVLNANNILDLTGQRELNQGDTFANGTIEVILEDEYDFSKVSYIDEKVSTDKDDTFYYTVTWKLRAFNEDEPVTEDSGTVIDYWQISNIARVVPYPSLPASTPPDWYRTPSIESLFPSLAELLRRLVAELEKYASRLLSGADLMRNFVEFLQAEVNRYAALARYILDEWSKIKNKFELPAAGVYYRAFKGVGGIPYFMTDLARSLLPSYTNAPPFHSGDEYVAGVVLLAGGLEADVEGFLTALNLFINTETEGAQDLVSNLSSAVASLEERYYGADMQLQDAPPEEAEETLTPRRCDPTEEIPVTFNNKMEVVDPDAIT